MYLKENNQRRIIEGLYIQVKKYLKIQIRIYLENINAISTCSFCRSIWLFWILFQYIKQLHVYNYIYKHSLYWVALLGPARNNRTDSVRLTPTRCWYMYMYYKFIIAVNILINKEIMYNYVKISAFKQFFYFTLI